MSTKIRNLTPEDFGVPAQYAERASNYAAFLVSAESGRWRDPCQEALEWMEYAWARIDGEWGPSGKTLDQECADGDEPEIAALRKLLKA